MSTALRVDIAAIDRDCFKVVDEDGEVLVIPLKSKFRWRDDELHLRSLVLDRDGRVLSAGFPKFFNLGENPSHDRALAEAMGRGVVEFPEKLDGSLLVADRVRGAARMRTRGRRVLGEFAPDVEPLVARAYPRLMDFLRVDPLLDEHSLLFEFVSPARAVVLRYDDARLHLLGLVSKRTVTARWDGATIDHVTRETGVAAAPLHPLPTDLDAALAQVRGWRGREGVVARFHDADGTPRMIKVKAEDYLRLHAYRSRLGNGRALKVAWLLDLREPDDVAPAFARYGLDWEATQFARGDVEPYLARRRAMLENFEAFCEAVAPWLGARLKTDKRAYVDRVRALMARDARFAEGHWFTVAMKRFDADADEARLTLDAVLLDEHAPTLRAWRKDPDAEVRAVLSAPVREDDA
jgi:hypothetical protein